MKYIYNISNIISLNFEISQIIELGDKAIFEEVAIKLIIFLIYDSNSVFYRRIKYERNILNAVKLKNVTNYTNLT